MDRKPRHGLSKEPSRTKPSRSTIRYRISHGLCSLRLHWDAPCRNPCYTQASGRSPQNRRSAMEKFIAASDKSLVLRTMSGDTAAYEGLVKRYAGVVWSICLSYVPRASDCEDVAQEVFTKAFINLYQRRTRDAFGLRVSKITIQLARKGIRDDSSISFPE